MSRHPVKSAISNTISQSMAEKASLARLARVPFNVLYSLGDQLSSVRDASGDVNGCYASI